MQDSRKSKAAWSAGMAAVLLSALAFAQPAAFAADDHMMKDDSHGMSGMMMMADHEARLRGNIASVQAGDSGAPQWVQSGIWVLSHTGDNVSFIARINMVGADGTSPHMHTINYFAAEKMSTQGNTHTIFGTATVSATDGNVPNVPVTISIINDAVITIQIDPAALGGHFGKNPIYGTVSHASRSAMMGHAMMADDHKLTKTSVPVTLPLTRGYVNGNEVFYISTEASDKDLAEHLTDVTGSRVAYTPALAKTPAGSLANIYAFSNGVVGPGPLGFQPNVADSQPGDVKYSPLWRINVVQWQNGTTPRELKSEQEILQASAAGQVKVTFTDMVVNCPFVQWHGGSLQMRQDKTLTNGSPYGGGQVLGIDTQKMQATFVAHRGFAPDGSTIYYIATDASVKEVADALGVIFVQKTGGTLATSAASDLYVFANGIKGTGPLGFQASIASTNIGDAGYSPMWRILATKWNDPAQAKFLTSAGQIADAADAGKLSTEVAGAVVNCPFVVA